MCYSKYLATCMCMCYSKYLATCMCMCYSKYLATCMCMCYSKYLATCMCMCYSKYLATCMCMCYSLFPSCQILMSYRSLSISQADFREEDVEISERVDELTNSLSNLCRGYHIVTECSDTANTSRASQMYCDITVTPAGHTPDHTPTESLSLEDSIDDDDFQKFCLEHPQLAGQYHTDHYGYNTLPLPPAPRHKKVTNSPPARSHSYDGKKDFGSRLVTPHQTLTPRHSYPQGDYYFHYQEYSRPLSYQEISYEETSEFEDSLDNSSWTDLSCP